MTSCKLFILAIDVEKERISLGVKQLTEEPSDAVVTADNTAAKPKAKAKATAKPTAEEVAAASGNTNLGALLKAKMDDKK